MKIKLLITGLAATVAVTACSAKDKTPKLKANPSSFAGPTVDKKDLEVSPTEQVQGMDAMTMAWDDVDAKKVYQVALKALNVRLLVNGDIQTIMKREVTDKSQCTFLNVGMHVAAGDQMFIKNMVGEQHDGKLKVTFTFAKVDKDGSATADGSINSEMTLRCVTDGSLFTFGSISEVLKNEILFESAN